MADDGQLLEAWRAGDRKAGERLFDRHYASVARFFRNKAFEEADDLVQQAFLACVGGKDRFEGRSSFRSYLFGVCHNVLKTHYRKARQQRERIEWGHVSVQDLAPGMSTMMGRKAEEQMTLMALRQLSVEDQVIMELYFWESLRAADIADALQMPEGSVRTRIRRARMKLEELVGQMGQEHGEALARRTQSGLEDWIREVKGLASGGA